MGCFTKDSPRGKGRQDGREIFAIEGLAVHMGGEILEGPGEGNTTSLGIHRLER